VVRMRKERVRGCESARSVAGCRVEVGCGCDEGEREQAQR
jgi:hypothetical protein